MEPVTGTEFGWTPLQVTVGLALAFGTFVIAIGAYIAAHQFQYRYPTPAGVSSLSWPQQALAWPFWAVGWIPYHAWHHGFGLLKACLPTSSQQSDRMDAVLARLDALERGVASPPGATPVPVVSSASNNEPSSTCVAPVSSNDSAANNIEASPSGDTQDPFGLVNLERTAWSH